MRRAARARTGRRNDIFLLHRRRIYCIIFSAPAGVMELVDVVDSKSTAGDSVPVRVRSPAPRRSKVRFAPTFFFTKERHPPASLLLLSNLQTLRWFVGLPLFLRRGLFCWVRPPRAAFTLRYFNARGRQSRPCAIRFAQQNEFTAQKRRRPEGRGREHHPPASLLLLSNLQTLRWFVGLPLFLRGCFFVGFRSLCSLRPSGLPRAVRGRPPPRDGGRNSKAAC